MNDLCYFSEYFIMTFLPKMLRVEDCQTFRITANKGDASDVMTRLHGLLQPDVTAEHHVNQDNLIGTDDIGIGQ